MKLLKILFISCLFMMVACDKLGEDLLINPNAPSPETADVNLYLNDLQLNFRNFYGGATDYGAQLTRTQHMFGPLYGNAYSGVTFNGMWYNAYAGVMKSANALIPVAEKLNLTTHVGIAKILKAYTLMVLVDNFGDIPFAEANNADITNPKIDAGKDVYAGAVKLLDEAISSLSKAPGANPTTDMYYAGNRTRWTALANTLKLRAAITTRLVDGTAKATIESLLTADLIDTDAEDFVFRFGNKFENPNTRHPKYNDSYGTGSGGVSPYQANHWIWALRKEKGVDDPRLRYYLKRQVNHYNFDAFTIPCAAQARPAHYPAASSFCVLELGNGYWGRDHGDGSGIPPDNLTRTGWGVYPAAGAFDAMNMLPWEGTANAANRVQEIAKVEAGAKGNGIHPIWMSSFTDFVKAEAALILKTTGDPKAFLESGVRKSINRVIGFPSVVGITVPASFVPSADSVTAYANRVKALYDAAATDGDRLNIIIKEFRLAAFGNGVEIYNAYRRTGKPDNLQLTLAPDPGAFIRSLQYPADFTNFNKNATAKTATNVKVFWDTNPDPLK